MPDPENSNEPPADSLGPPVSSEAVSSEAVPASGEGHVEKMPSTEADYIEALRQVIDPELMINIIDLGLIYSIEQDEQNSRRVKVDMTLTSPACPAGPQLVQQSRMALERLHDVDEAAINMVMSPPWTPERMTDDARDQLGIF
jgi:metal-sulfur cluster biosynthetic enzyme